VDRPPVGARGGRRLLPRLEDASDERSALPAATGEGDERNYYDRIAAVHVDELTRRVKNKENFTLLDVREEEEVKQSGRFPDALHIFLGDLPDQIDQVPTDKLVTTFCGSGMRAIIAASTLKQNGFEHVEDNLGSMAACQAAGCPIVDGHLKNGVSEPVQ